MGQALSAPTSRPRPGYLVVVFHVLQVALLTDEQVQILLPISMHGLHVSLPEKGAGGGGTLLGECLGHWKRPVRFRTREWWGIRHI